MGKSTESEQELQLKQLKTSLNKFRCITPESTVDLDSDWDDESAVPHLMNPNALSDQGESEYQFEEVPNSPIHRYSCLPSVRPDSSSFSCNYNAHDYCHYNPSQSSWVPASAPSSPILCIDKSCDTFGCMEKISSLSLSAPSSPLRSATATTTSSYIRHRRSASQPGVKPVRYGSTLSTLKEGYESSDWDIPEMTIQYHPPQYRGFQHSHPHRRALSLPEQILDKIGSELYILSPTRESLQSLHSFSIGDRVEIDPSISEESTLSFDSYNNDRVGNIRSPSNRRRISKSDQTKYQASITSSVTQSNDTSSLTCLEDKVAFAWKNQRTVSEPDNTKSNNRDSNGTRHKRAESFTTLKQSKKTSHHHQNRVEQTDKSCVVQ